MLRRQDVGHRVVVRRIVGVSPGSAAFLGRPRRARRPDRDGTHHRHRTRARCAYRCARCTGPSGCRPPAGRRPPTSSPWSWPPTTPGRRRSRTGWVHWMLRAADNWTGRANSALAVGDPDRPLEAAIDAVDALVRRPRPAGPDQRADAAGRAGQRGPRRARLDGPAADPGADRAAGRRCWPPPAATPDLPPVELADAPDRRLARHGGRAQGRPARGRGADPHRRTPRSVFAHVHDDRPAACSRSPAAR